MTNKLTEEFSQDEKQLIDNLIKVNSDYYNRSLNKDEMNLLCTELKIKKRTGCETFNSSSLSHQIGSYFSGLSYSDVLNDYQNVTYDECWTFIEHRWNECQKMKTPPTLLTYLCGALLDLKNKNKADVVK